MPTFAETSAALLNANPTPETAEEIDESLRLLRAHRANLNTGDYGVATRDAVDAQIRALETQRSRIAERDVQDKFGEGTDALNPFVERTPEEQAEWDRQIGLIDPATLQQYGIDDPLRTIGDAERISAPELGDSAYQDATSAFGGLAFDERSLEGIRAGQNYFGNIAAGGEDAVSEAAYQRRLQDAEQIRRGQMEAALAAEEARGGSSAGARVLAEGVASQQQVGDAYGGALESKALQQGRMDSAAGSAASLANVAGQNIFAADSARATGEDAFARSRNAAIDARMSERASYDFDASGYNAGLETDAANTNWNRDISNRDANVDLANQITSANAASTAAATGNYFGALTGQGGQALGQGDLDLGRERSAFEQDQANDPWNKHVLPAVRAGAAVAKT